MDLPFLFNRLEEKIPNEAVQYYKNKSVLITGAAGFIGSELARSFIKTGYKQLLLLDQSESDLFDLQEEFKMLGVQNFRILIADIRDKKSLCFLFKKYNPTIVFHAAAYKHVPLMEEFPHEAIRTNIQGTKNVVDVTIQQRISKFVFISTDKAVNPTGIMGVSKRIAELYIQCINNISRTKFSITRFGNVWSSSGSVIPLFQKQILNGGPITITDKKMTRYFMSVSEACLLVLQAGLIGVGGDVFVFDMGKPISIYKLAKSILKQAGLKYPEDIDIKFIGKRAGERLNEELLINPETTEGTSCPKIKIVKER